MTKWIPTRHILFQRGTWVDDSIFTGLVLIYITVNAVGKKMWWKGNLKSLLITVSSINILMGNDLKITFWLRSHSILLYNSPNGGNVLLYLVLCSVCGVA